MYTEFFKINAMLYEDIIHTKNSALYSVQLSDFCTLTEVCNPHSYLILEYLRHPKMQFHAHH